jgi:hypothetical protein
MDRETAMSAPVACALVAVFGMIFVAVVALMLRADREEIRAAHEAPTQQLRVVVGWPQTSKRRREGPRPMMNNLRLPQPDVLERVLAGLRTYPTENPPTRGVATMADIHYVSQSVDLTGLFNMECPTCGQDVRVQGNAMGLWIVEHRQGHGVCPASNRTIRQKTQP